MIDTNTILHIYRNLIIIIIIGILITSICSAGIYSNNIEVNESEDIIIDPSLSLNKNHIPILEEAKVKCTNPTMKNILVKIIETLKQKYPNAKT